MPSTRLPWNPPLVALVLSAVAFFLVLASIASTLITFFVTGIEHYHWLARAFYLDAEKNIPTFFSVVLLFCAFLLLAFITVAEKKREMPHVLYWAVLSFGFLFMAADERFCFHERLGKHLRQWMGCDHLVGCFYFSWVIPALAVVLILALFFLRFWWQLPPKTRFNFLTAAVIFLGGCIGLEMVGGWYVESHGFVNLTYCLLATLEESMEMGGVILFIWGLMTHIGDCYMDDLFAFTEWVKKLELPLPSREEPPPA